MQTTTVSSRSSVFQIMEYDIIFCFASIILSFLIFPYFRKVFLKNKAKDQNTPIFLITYHFYKVLRFVEILIIFLIVMIIMCLLSGCLSHVIKNETINIITKLIYYPCQLISLVLLGFIIITYFITTPVCLFLISYLSIQRFFLFLKPEIGEFLTLKRTRFFILLYLTVPPISCCSGYASFAGTLISSLANVQEALKKVKSESGFIEWSSPILQVLGNIYVVLDFLTLICTIPYLVMIVKIKKLKSKMSTQESTHNPENYIFCQILILIITKLIVIIFVYLYAEQHGNIDFNRILFWFTSIFTFPTIQFSYLFSSSKNLKMFLNVPIKIWNAITVCMCRSSSVQPIGDLSSTVIPSHNSRNYLVNDA